MADLTQGAARKSDGTRPVILIAPRLEQPPHICGMTGELSPEEAGAKVFMDAVLAAGGLPLIMPLTTDPEHMAELVAHADGIAVPGGQDVSPALWGDTDPYDETLLCPERDAFEFPLIEAALEADKPLFTTCRGTQMLNVVLGGTLCMDVPNRPCRDGMVPWRHAMILHDPAHPVEVLPESLLERVVGSPLIQVNSSHHCCVERLGRGVKVVAEATDGVPEAIEVTGQRFCLGVQWHPEYTWRALKTDFALWRAFVEAAAGRDAAI